MTNRDFIQLLTQWREERISKQDAMVLMEAIRSGQYDLLLDDTLQGHWDAEDLSGIVKVEHKAEVLQALQQLGYAREAVVIKTMHRVHFLRTAWFRIAVAVLLFGCVGAYLWLKPSINASAITQTIPARGKGNILPGGNKAILKLADGSEIVLDGAGDGKLAEQPGAIVQKTADGRIVYSFNKALLSKKISINTMSTPRGGQYQLILPDGTGVWLNAESAITFPTAFTGSDREVSITGEAYFEVVKDKNKPFRVKAGKETIEVIGTSFNINAYSDEPVMKTSLLEGAIKINNNVVKPGEAYVNGKVVKTDISQDLAWKNGAFYFKKIEPAAVLRQISRWYNVDIRYQGKIPEGRISGKMGRDLNLTEVLSVLEGLEIRTKLNGRTLLILSE